VSGREGRLTRLMRAHARHVPALDMPFVTLPLEHIVHCDRLRPGCTLGHEADLGVGFFLAEGDRIDIDVHASDVDFFGDVFDDAILHRFGRIDIFRAARQQERGETDGNRFHVPIIPAGGERFD
jgi:hypothetical protein